MIEVPVSQFERVVRENERLKCRVEQLEDRMFELKENIIQLIDDEADYKLERARETGETQTLYYLTIEEVAKAIGIDWRDYLKNWREEMQKAKEEHKEDENPYQE